MLRLLAMNSRMVTGLILLLACTLLCACAFSQGYQDGLTKSREAYLLSDLSMMRDGIKKYTSEQGHPPQSLNDLVDGEYVTHIPRDPITNEVDWIITRYDCATVANCQKGIKDIHSASTAKSSKGNVYAGW